GTDESAHHRNLPHFDERENLFLKSKICFFVLWDRLHVGAVGDQHIAGVDVSAFQPASLKCGGDDLARKHLAEGGDMIGGAGCDFADGGDAAEEFVERFEILAELGMEFGEAGGAEE